MSAKRLMYAILLFASSYTYAQNSADMAAIQAWTAEHSSQVVGVAGALNHIVNKHDYAALHTINETRRALVTLQEMATTGHGAATAYQTTVMELDVLKRLIYRAAKRAHENGRTSRTDELTNCLIPIVRALAAARLVEDTTTITHSYRDCIVLGEN